MIQRGLAVVAAIAGLIVTMAVATLPAGAQDDIRRERVRFAPGDSGITLRDSLQGYETVDYVLSAREGQTMRVSLQTSNRFAFFNVLPPGGGEALFNASIDGNAFDAVLEESGDHVVRVYLMRNAARRGEVARFRLDISIVDDDEPLPSPLPDDFADSLSGGPDFWEVTGVPRSDLLNLRRGPSARTAIVGSLDNGEFLRNLGCRIERGQRWCRVETVDDSRVQGWVAGRYLREGNP